MKANNPNLDLVSINSYIDFLIKICPFVLKILSGNEILAYIKGHISRTSLWKIMCNNPNVDLVNMNAYKIKFVNFCPFVLKILNGSEILA